VPRRSEAADWAPVARPEIIRLRAELLGRIRQFFRERGVLEVETPQLSRHATTEPALQSFTLDVLPMGGTEGQPRYLQTSPELAMKRLLAAGIGPIYQVCRAFRGGERGGRHNPEFTLLEWYRPEFTYHRLMDEVAALVRQAWARPGLKDERIAYGDLFQGRLGVDAHRAKPGELQAAAVEQGIPDAEHLELPRDAWLDLLMSQCIEPDLGRGRMTFIFDYPSTQASLARVRRGPTPVAERFELYLEGMELANGFQELTDPAEQRRRFERDQQQRARSGSPKLSLDERFLGALQAGLPVCSGVALGLDRLLMVMSGASRIDQVLTFPWERA